MTKFLKKFELEKIIIIYIFIKKIVINKQIKISKSKFFKVF